MATEQSTTKKSAIRIPTVWRLGIYLLVVYLFLVSLTFLAWQRSSFFALLGLSWSAVNAETFQRAIYALSAGGLGGTTYCIWALLQHHCKENNFDEKWKLWYILTPVSGSLLGIATFAVIVGGLLVLGGSIALENNWAVFALCYLAGYSSKRVLWKLDSLAEEIFQGKSRDKAKKEEKPKEP